MQTWLELAARRRPDRLAIATAGRSIQYAELQALVAERVTQLAREGVGAGDCIALAQADPAQFVISLHACFALGAVAVPIDLRLTPAEQAARSQPGRVAPGVAVVMHTSGTTSIAKPVTLSSQNFLASALASAAVLGLDLGERWLCPMPLTHVGGLSIPLRSAVYATTAILHERFDTDAVLSALMNSEQRITLVSLVPTMLARLLDAGLERPPTLRWALLGGGPISSELLDRSARSGVPVAPTYGMTEACSQIATFGWPLPGAELRLADAEVLVRGPMVSQASLAEDGWLHTGDLGAFDESGRLRITGRASDTIITGGENVSPVEVEDVLLAHPAVADAAVVGRPDAEWGDAVVALVVRRAGARFDPEEVRAHCRSHLASFKVPKTIEVAEALPRSASGKLLRRQLS